MQAGQGLFHQGMPGIVIACQCRLLSHNGVAHRFYPYEGEPSGKRCIVRHGEVFRWHCARAARTLLLAVGHDGLLHTTVDLVLRPIRGADTPIEARDPQEQTDEAHPTGPHFGVDQVERHNQPMQEGETSHTAQKRHDHRALIAALVGGSPSLQGAARDVKPLGRLTLGEALGVPMAIPLTQCSAFDTLPALVAILVALRLLLHDCAHSDLLCHPSAFVYVMAKDGEVAFSFQPSAVSSDCLAEVVIETKWPTR